MLLILFVSLIIYTWIKASDSDVDMNKMVLKECFAGTKDKNCARSFILFYILKTVLISAALAYLGEKNSKLK